MGDKEESIGDTPNPGSILLHRDGADLQGRIACAHDARRATLRRGRGTPDPDATERVPPTATLNVEMERVAV